MFSNHYDIEKFQLNYSRTFDSTGIILQKKKYHPLTICTYGILCYDKFKETGDSSYFEKLKSQYSYFQDTSKLQSTFNNKGIGLPYNFKYLDLKSPWYSGLTQGIALSFLIRCQEIFKDDFAGMLSKKVLYHMLQPDSLGGTLSRNSEGLIWIEEYPNTKKSKHVLNGFIIGLIGLKEYTDFNPKDTNAIHKHENIFKSFVSSIPKYNTSNWTRYNRNNLTISNQYMRFQISQMDHLYQLYQDSTFIKQMMIWSMQFSNKKDKELKFYIRPEMNFSFEFDEHVQDYRIHDDIQFKSVNYRSFYEKKSKKRLNKKNHIIKNFNPVYEVVLHYTDDKIYQNIKEIRCYDRNNKVLNKTEVYKDRIHSLKSDSLIHSCKLFFHKKMKAKKPIFDSISTVSIDKYNHPYFAHKRIDSIYKIEKEKPYQIALKGKHIDNTIIFYRHHKEKSKVHNSVFSYKNSFKANETITFENDHFYEFFISIPINYSLTRLEGFQLKKIESKLE